jgi:exonuclease VII large subunit
MELEPETSSASAALRECKALCKAVSDINPYAAAHGHIGKEWEKVRVRLEAEGYFRGWTVQRLQTRLKDLVRFKEKAQWLEWPNGQRVLDPKNKFGLDANGLTLLAAPLEKVEHLREEARRQREEKTGTKRKAEDEALQRALQIRDIAAKRTRKDPHWKAKQPRKRNLNTEGYIEPNSEGGIRQVTPTRGGPFNLGDTSPLGREPRSDESRRLVINSIMDYVHKHSQANVQERRTDSESFKRSFEELKQQNVELKEMICSLVSRVSELERILRSYFTGGSRLPVASPGQGKMDIAEERKEAEEQGDMMVEGI